MNNNIGWSGLNRRGKYNSNFLVNLSQTTSNIITIARVVDILLDNSDPDKFKAFGEWNGIGNIKFQTLDKRIQATANLAKPLESNLKKFPLVNELVYIIGAPNTEIGNSPYAISNYYISTLSLWNHPHHNAYPSNPNSLAPSQNKDYTQTQAGSARRVTDESTEIFLGKTFKERANVHPLLPFEGDVMLEGRWGNSIRLGSTVKNTNNNWSNSGTNGDPITIIRNGQGNQSEEGWVPITEDINNDGSSIYLTSAQKIPLSATSKDYTSYGEDPTPIEPNQFVGAQIVLNSGRLMFNSLSDHILFSSAISINLNAQKSVNIDTEKLIVQSDKIFLGTEDLAKEPLLLGDTTAQLLRDLVSTLKELANTLQTLQSEPVVQGAPATFVTSLMKPAANATLVLESLEKQLGDSPNNCKLTSKRNFTL